MSKRGRKRKGGLNAKQARFAAEYLIDLNATQAAIRAGYSEKTASSQGERLLRNDEINAAVQEGIEARAERTHITQDQVLREIAALAMSSVAHYSINDAGDVAATADAPELAMRAVASIKKRIRCDEDGVITTETELKLWDKPAALRMAGQHFKMFTDQTEIRVTVTHEDALKELA